MPGECLEKPGANMHPPDLDCSAALVQCPGPILYLAAARDVVVHRASFQQMLAIRQDVQIKVLEGSHTLLQTNPAGAWGEIERFLDQIGAMDLQMTRYHHAAG